MRNHYLRHLANIIDIQWSRLVLGGGGGGGNSKLKWFTFTDVNAKKSVVSLRLQTNMMQYSR